MVLVQSWQFRLMMTRDWAFAKKFNLPIVEVVAGGDVQNAAFTDVQTGTLVNSGFLDGLEVADAKKKIVECLEENKIGTPKKNYKLQRLGILTTALLG